MQQTYISVEGINIYPNVLDTDQLSVIRGSSFVLKHAIEHIKSNFTEQLTAITTGASAGIFLFNNAQNNSNNVSNLIDEITSQLELPPYCYFTFSVEHCEAKSFLQAKEILISQLRFNQMRGINTVPDRFNKDYQQQNQPCQLEGRRIAATHTDRMVQKKTRKLSLSVYKRLLFGRELRQDFYFQAGNIDKTKTLNGYGFVDDFEALSNNISSPKLNNKMAVIYMDGNTFSAIQNKILKSATVQTQISKQQMFDEKVQTKRADFLKQTLSEMIKDNSTIYPHSLTFNTTQSTDLAQNNKTQDTAIRFETLLWGGDEMLFVLPAWNGFELLQSFFQISSDWAVENENKSISLTHAAGIVFCSCKTPIRVIREIAQSLADNIKDKLGDDRNKNTWDYMVLESIDYPVNNDIDDFNRKRFGNMIAADRPRYFAPLPLGEWSGCKNILKQLIVEKLLSRRQLYRIVDALLQQKIPATISWNNLTCSEGLPQSATPQDIAERRMLLLVDQSQREILMAALSDLSEKLFTIDIQQGAKRAWLWLNLIELWDYLVPSWEAS